MNKKIIVNEKQNRVVQFIYKKNDDLDKAITLIMHYGHYKSKNKAGLIKEVILDMGESLQDFMGYKADKLIANMSDKNVNTDSDK